jgi:hypothetical protein
VQKSGHRFYSFVADRGDHRSVSIGVRRMPSFAASRCYPGNNQAGRKKENPARAGFRS